MRFCFRSCTPYHQLNMEAAKLRTYLECPICFLLPRGKILSCANSHQICGSCFKKLGEDAAGAKHCPQGGCEYDMPPRRARGFEAMIENSDFEQNCRKPGCNVEMKKDLIEAHEQKCIFRKVPCPVTSCQNKVVFKNIDLHIMLRHKTITRTQPNVKPSMNEESLNELDRNQNWLLFTYLDNGVQFYPVLVKRNGLFYFWVSIKDNPEAASAWVFTAKTKSGDNKFEVRARGLVHPVDMTVDEIIETGQYLLMNRKCVEKLTYQKGNSRSKRIGIAFTVKKE